MLLVSEHLGPLIWRLKILTNFDWNCKILLTAVIYFQIKMKMAT